MFGPIQLVELNLVVLCQYLPCLLLFDHEHDLFCPGNEFLQGLFCSIGPGRPFSPML